MRHARNILCFNPLKRKQMKKSKIFILYFICLCSVGTLSAQQVEKQEKASYVVIPREISLPVIASQPDCPVQFERVRLVRGIGKERGTVAFQLRNQGTKPVRGVSFAVAYSHGGGWMDSRPTTLAAPWIMPGELVPLGGENEVEVIIPLTEELRDKLKLRGWMQVVAVFMIVSVSFADGTTYNDEPTYKA